MQSPTRNFVAWVIAALLIGSCSGAKTPKAGDQGNPGAGIGANGTGAAGGTGQGRLDASSVKISAESVPDGMRMSLINVLESKARRSVEGVPESATYAGSFSIGGAGSLNGQTMKIRANSEIFDITFPAEPVLKLPVTVALFDARTGSGALGLAAVTTTQVACTGSECSAVAGSNDGNKSDTKASCVEGCRTAYAKCFEVNSNDNTCGLAQIACMNKCSPPTPSPEYSPTPEPSQLITCETTHMKCQEECTRVFQSTAATDLGAADKKDSCSTQCTTDYRSCKGIPNVDDAPTPAPEPSQPVDCGKALEQCQDRCTKESNDYEWCNINYCLGPYYYCREKAAKPTQ